MEVRYQNEPADIADALALVPLALRLWIRWMAALFIAVIFAPLAIVFAGIGQWQVVILIGGIVLVLISWSLWKQRRSQMVVSRRLLQSVHLELFETGIMAQTPIGWVWRDWTVVQRVASSASCVLLFLAPLEFLLIPRRAFGGDAEMQRFREEAERLLSADRVRRASESSAVERPADVVQRLSAAAAASPMPWRQVVYANTRSQLAKIAAGVIPKQTGAATPQANTHGRRVLTWLFFVVILLTMVLALQPWNDPSPLSLPRGKGANIGVALFIGIAGMLLAALSVVWLQRWILGRCYGFRRLGPKTLTIRAEGVFFEDSWTAGQSYWSSFDMIAASDETLVMLIALPNLFYAIPLAAFPGGPSEAEGFLQLARHYWEAAQDSETVTATLVDQSESSEASQQNPYRPPTSM